MSLTRRMLPALAVVAAMRAAPALAQCPDGTPPPCRIAAPAPVRRAAPPLDDRTWIVLPFDNIARAPDIEWLRDASVNLLYLDMSKWRDIRVIDDERVADFVREAPEARGAGMLGLEAGRAIARRAGAGKLVMGDLLKVGSRTQVVAKVFDVRSGQRLRSIRAETTSPDSVMGLFTQLARGILDVAPPAGVSGTAIGTASLGAYQEYLAGVADLNAWELEAARRHFDTALGLDTAFALAHYKLSMVYGWVSASAPERVVHAEAANRFAAGLPQRERTLIAGQLAQSHGQWGDACEAYTSLVRADSTDVDGWYNVGECNYHDIVVAPQRGDTARLAFRGDWNAALRAFRRTLELDPSYHLAFAHIPDILQAELRTGCRPSATNLSCATVTHAAYVVRQGDSLAIVPVPAADAAALAAQAGERVRSGTRHANALLARDLAAAWVQAGPRESRSHRALGHALLRTGDPDGADRELRLAGTAGTRAERTQAQIDRVEVAIKRERFAEALAQLDTLSVLLDSAGDANVKGPIVVLDVGFGRFRSADQLVRGLVPPQLQPFLAVAFRLFAAAPADSSQRVLDAYAATVRQQGPRGQDLRPVLATWGFRWMRQWTPPPEFDTAQARERRARVAIRLLAGDTAGARRALTALDSFALALPVETPNGGAWLVSAEAHLALGDSATAYERLLAFERAWPYADVMEVLSPGLAFGSMIWPRSFLLLGDLAAAQGHADVAARAYRRVVGLWQQGDADVQPAVQHAREALARLGAS